MITCTFENGNEASLRHLTVNAIITKDNKILLGKRGTLNGKPILETGKWGLIGGFMDRDEDLIKAVKREAMEESGWELDDIKLFRINDNPNRPKEDRQNVDLIFLAKAKKQLKFSDEETKELRWFGLDKLPEKDMFAFDHGESVALYIKYKKERHILPILG